MVLIFSMEHNVRHHPVARLFSRAIRVTYFLNGK